MHTEEPTLSVICVFRNRKDWVEPTLKALYSIHRIPCEFIFIDDASTDGTTETLRSLIEYYQHEQTYFFEQEAVRGRGNSLNSALEQVRGRILWIPENLSTLDQEALEEAIASLADSKSHVAIALEDPVPESPLDWLHLLQNERLPNDRNVLFDLRKIRTVRKFIDPHWTARHASEWMIRLQADSDPLSVPSFAKGDNRLLTMDDRSRKECILALLRIPEMPLSGQEKAFRMLRSYGQTDQEEDEGSAEILYQEAQALYKSGNSVAALEILNRILAADPDHRRARLFKIQILEKMRRYVEAAELKHGYDIRKGEDEPTPAAEPAPTTEPAREKESEEQPVEDDSREQPAEDDSRELPAEDDSRELPSGESGLVIDLSDTDEDESMEPVKDIGLPPEKKSVTEIDLTDKEEPDAETGPGAEKKPDAETGTGAEKEPEVTAEPEVSTTEPQKKPAGEMDEHEEPDEVKPATASVFGDEISRQKQLSIIIPTAAIQRPLLEDCLTSVFRHTSADRTHLIIIDNGSADDTPAFLNKLVKERPLLTVLRNEQNLGFAGAVNQGLAKAGDGVVLVMHNDVILKNPVPARLAQKLEKNPDIGLIVPRTNRTWYKIQLDEHTDDQPFTDTDIVDGYLMAFRNQPGLAMSREYGLAYFDDTDFCYRLKKKGFRIVIDNREQVVHHAEKTTRNLGLTRFSKMYWKNSAFFHKEWGLEPQFPANHTSDDPLRQFVILGEIINPFYPEQHLIDYFNHLFTSEEKTRVLQVEYPPNALKPMIRLMMAANQREVLRRLEQQLDALPPDHRLYQDLITFYYDRTIYSRCKLYLDRLGDTDLPVELAIFHLKIAIGEKDFARAAELLKKLMDRVPTHPEVLITAAEIHRKNGNQEQSEKFTALARTFDPFVRP